MHVPSYLIKSRHGVFYFRYPIHDRRVSVSLKTRCPREALKLARVLEYHTHNLIEGMDLRGMDASEAIQLLRDYYHTLLAEKKAHIDKFGPMSADSVKHFQAALMETQALIDADVDSIDELHRIWGTTDSPTDEIILNVLDKSGTSLAQDSVAYLSIKKAYKHVVAGYLQELLEYNRDCVQFKFQPAPQAIAHTTNTTHIKHRLSTVLGAYLNEIQPTLTPRSFNDQRGCLDFLTDWLGHDYPLSGIDNIQAQKAKELLSAMPANRNKSKQLKGKPLLEQIEIAKQHGHKTLSNTTINKHLGYFDMFMTWAANNKYTNDNPFKGIRIKAVAKRVKRRDYFDDEDIAIILNNLDDSEIVKNKSQYWGALIAIYTGARRGEIAALTPDNVIKDDKTGIWYFDITDEDEDKKTLKTEAAKRTVPVHSALIEHGFLDFIEESRREGKRIRHKHGLQSRLLYHLTFTENEGWGRNLGRWFNERYLPALDLKTAKKSLHSLRHSFITHLSAAEGVEAGIIKALVGHEDNTVTAQNYTHFGILHLPKFQTAIEKLPY